jgi:trk/ktr system potassium uptake protein
MRLDSLSYTIRYPVVLAHLGELALALAIVTAVPLAVCLLLEDFAVALRYVTVVAMLAGSGVLLIRLPKPASLQSNEGMVLVALTFVLAPVAMVYPMMAAGLRFEDALFEAVSGVTTTGLTTIASPQAMSRAFLFARAWMQWYGGLGIVVLSLAFVVHPGLAAKRLAVNEQSTDDLAGGTKAYARRVTIVYALLTAAGIAGLWLLGLTPFDAIVYSLAAVSTGGFSPHQSSLAGIDSWWAQAAVTLLCLGGATAFTLYYKLRRDRQHAGVELVQLRGLLALSGIATLLVGIALWRVEGMEPAAVLRHAPLIALSAQTTAGFSTLDVAQLHAATKLALIPEMAIGGSVGSTAGGFKILRLLVLLRLAQVVVARARSARHAVIDVRLAGSRVEEPELNGVLLLILLYSAVILLSWVPFVALGYQPLDALFEVVSATGTVGLSAGVTSTTLPIALKGVLCADMLLGRLEIVCWLVALHPRTWFGRRLPFA